MVPMCIVCCAILPDDVTGCSVHPEAPLVLEARDIIEEYVASGPWLEERLDNTPRWVLDARIVELLEHPALGVDVQVTLRSDTCARVLQAAQQAGEHPDAWLRRAVLAALKAGQAGYG